MQWRLLRRRGPLRSFTIVGDLAQTAAAQPPADWAEAIRALGDEFRLEELTVNYRTPRQITELAEERATALGLPVTPARSVREGAWPVREGTVERAGLAEAVVRAAIDDRAIDADGSVAVIAPETLVPELHDALLAGIGEPVGFGSEGLGSRITVMGPRTAKGLEFDTAIVVDQRGIVADSGAGSLYVALTRPTQRLAVLDPR